MISDEADEVMKEHFDSLKNRYQNNLESMKGSEFVYNHVRLLYCKCQKINMNRSGYIYSLNWIKNKHVAINLINKKDNRCSQYTIIVALNHEEIKKKSTKNNKN